MKEAAQDGNQFSTCSRGNSRPEGIDKRLGTISSSVLAILGERDALRRRCAQLDKALVDEKVLSGSLRGAVKSQARSLREMDERVAQLRARIAELEEEVSECRDRT